MSSEFITLGLVVLVIGGIIYMITKTVCDKKATDYFNANIKEKLTNMFNGHEKEILTHLDDLQNLKEFKESKILICNDINNIIYNMAFFSNFTNLKIIKHIDTTIKLNDFSTIILYAKDDETLEKWHTYLKDLKETVPLLIFTDGVPYLKNFELYQDKIYTGANNKFTLIERLHSAYLIKKIVK